MKWHVILLVGQHDSYTPDLPVNAPRISASIDRPGDPYSIRNNILKEVVEHAKRSPTPIVLDLVHLALAVYTADVKVRRNLSEDRWTRSFVLHVPVSHLEQWNALRPLLSQMLNFLTGDDWEIEFRHRRAAINLQVHQTAQPKVDTAGLFSGGLDSLVGTIDLLEEGKHVALVGHYGSGITKSIQDDVLRQLTKRYGDQITPFLFFVQPSKKKLGKGEPSMRSRSFLFLALGVLVAGLFKLEVPLIVAENGLISLNVPLTQSRVGSLSTRTTHPYLMLLYQQLLSHLNISTVIQMPYRFQTKGEMLAEAKNAELIKSLSRVTMSCSHPESGRFFRHSPSLHCGYCVPCIIRRAAMYSAVIPDCEYCFDILHDPPLLHTQKGRDLRAFQIAIERYKLSSPHHKIFNVLSAGQLPPDDISHYSGVYTRGMQEVIQLLES